MIKDIYLKSSYLIPVPTEIEGFEMYEFLLIWRQYIPRIYKIYIL